MSEQELDYDAPAGSTLAAAESEPDLPTYESPAATYQRSVGRSPSKSMRRMLTGRLAWQQGIVSFAVLTISVLGLYVSLPPEWVAIGRPKTFFPLYFPAAGPSNILAVGALGAFVTNIVSILGFLMQILSSRGRAFSGFALRSVVVSLLGFAFALFLFSVSFKHSTLSIGFAVYLVGVVYLLLSVFTYCWIACLFKIHAYGPREYFIYLGSALLPFALGCVIFFTLDTHAYFMSLAFWFACIFQVALLVTKYVPSGGRVVSLSEHEFRPAQRLFYELRFIFTPLDEETEYSSVTYREFFGDMGFAVFCAALALLVQVLNAPMTVDRAAFSFMGFSF